MRKSGVRKAVLLSSVGSPRAPSTGNILTTQHLNNIFDELEIPATFLRAASLMNNWNGVIKVAAKKDVLPSFYQPLERKLPMIAALRRRARRRRSHQKFN